MEYKLKTSYLSINLNYIRLLQFKTYHICESQIVFNEHKYFINSYHMAINKNYNIF